MLLINDLYIFMIFFSDVFDAFIFLLLSFIIINIILVCSFQIADHNPTIEKISPYECGFDPYDDAHNEFDIKFYLFAILFLLFDIETIYFFPLIFHNFIFIDFSFAVIIDFILELMLCYLYAYKTDVFEFR